MSTDTDRLGAADRIADRTHFGAVWKYWKAAAYDSHLDRDVWAWVKLSVILGAAAFGAALAKVAVLLAIQTYPSLFPPPGTFVGTLLGALGQASSGIISLIGALAGVVVIKLMLRVFEDELEGDK